MAPKILKILKSMWIKLLSDLHDRLDKIVLESKSEDDPVHSVGVLVIWDACREALNLTKRSKCRRKLREGERQQAIIHSCMSGGRSEEAVTGSKNSPLILALSDLLGTNSPFNLFELAGHLNARVKAATKFRQSVELRYEGTKLNDCYDWFVDLESCNKLRAHDVVLKRLQAPIHDLKACARLISLWKVPCKSIESVEDVEDCLQSLRDSKQQLLSDSRAPMLDATVQALEQVREEAEALQERDDFRKALEAARRIREECLFGSVFIFFFWILPFSLCHCGFWSCNNCSANGHEPCCALWIVLTWIFAVLNSVFFFLLWWIPFWVIIPWTRRSILSARLRLVEKTLPYCGWMACFLASSVSPSASVQDVAMVVILNPATRTAKTPAFTRKHHTLIASPRHCPPSNGWTTWGSLFSIGR